MITEVIKDYCVKLLENNKILFKVSSMKEVFLYSNDHTLMFWIKLLEQNVNISITNWNGVRVKFIYTDDIFSETDLMNYEVEFLGEDPDLLDKIRYEIEQL